MMPLTIELFRHHHIEQHWQVGEKFAAPPDDSILKCIYLSDPELAFVYAHVPGLKPPLEMDDTRRATINYRTRS